MSLMWTAVIFALTSLVSVEARLTSKNQHDVNNLINDVTTLIHRVEQLETQKLESDKKTEKIQQRMELMERRVTAVEKENVVLDEANKELHEEVEELKVKNKDLREKLKQLETKHLDRTSKLTAATFTHTEGNSEIPEPSTTTNTTLSPATTTTSGPSCVPAPPVMCNNSQLIAFHVGGYQDTAGDIIYTSIYLNLGDAYSPTNGRFTAPVHGLYSFSFIIHAGPSCGSYVYVNLYINVSVQSDVWSSYYNTGSGSAVAQLSPGNQVYVYLGGCDDLNNDYNENTFSGYLIHEIL